ncbi:hypothetical protein K2X89_07520, partial [Myxococcota bacterium]|nr:hypothetical protein [Myxococcota bacterium]
SDSFAQILQDENVSLPDLEVLVVGVVLAIKESVRSETKSIPVEDDDFLLPGIQKKTMRRMQSLLRGAAELLRTGILDGVNFGDYVTDRTTARGLDDAANRASALISYREGRERIRNARSNGCAGAPMRPETILAAAMDQVLPHRTPAERRSLAALIIQDVLDITVTPDRLRTRLNDFHRRDRRK